MFPRTFPRFWGPRPRPYSRYLLGRGFGLHASRCPSLSYSSQLGPKHGIVRSETSRKPLALRDRRWLPAFRARRIALMGTASGRRQNLRRAPSHPRSARKQKGMASKDSVIDRRFLAELVKSANVLEHPNGKLGLRTAHMPARPVPMDVGDIKALRRRFKMSQAVFAHYLNVSRGLVQAWEYGRRPATGPALLLLRLIDQYPALVLSRTQEGSDVASKRPHRTAEQSRKTRQA